MKTKTAQLWDKQDQHQGDRQRLFAAVAGGVEVDSAFYPGCYVDVAPSFLFRSVTYLDMDKRTPRFFADTVGIHEIVSRNGGSSEPDIKFINGDYSAPLDLPIEHFDLLISLYAGFVTEHCTQHLKIGATLLVNPSHGDAAMASIDPRYVLAGLVKSDAGKYRVETKDLDSYMIPKKAQEITIESLHKSCRGIGYTKSPFAYLFRRVA